jgi:ferredoxin
MTDTVATSDSWSGEVGVGVKVRTHPGLCEGWGNCHRFAPEVYPLDAEGYIDVHLLDVPAELAAAARNGALACPERAITVIEANGDQI